MNFASLFKAFDAVMMVSGAARRLRSDREELPVPSQPAVLQGLANQVETRLTNVVVAALKEAFDRDHARLALEREQLEEQRRRADEALRLELRRQAADREVSRLRLLAGTALIGWLSTVLLLGWRLPLASPVSRIVLVLGWLCLLGALAAAFSAMARAGDLALEASAAQTGRASALPLWLLIGGLASTALTLML